MGKRVIIAIPVLKRGGTEIQTLALVKVLVGLGYEVETCCYYEYEQEIVNQYESAGANVALLKLNPEDGLWSLYRELLVYFRSKAPHIVHVQYMAPGLVPIIAARIAGVRAVLATVHQPATPYGWKPRLLLKVASLLCRVFLCVSQTVEKSWFGSSEVFTARSLGHGRKHFTIFNAVNSGKIENLTNAEMKVHPNLCDEYGMDDVIGYVGRLREEKGVDILIRAIAILHKTNPNVVLVVVGDGPDLKKLKLLAQELGIENSVHWLGSKSQDEVFSLFSVMDILTVPSRFEGFGLVAVEAMAAGLPVVASNADGLREVVKDGETGLSFESGNPNDLAEKLLFLLNKPDVRNYMGMAGRVRVQENFSIEQYGQRIERLYTTILNA